MRNITSMFITVSEIEEGRGKLILICSDGAEDYFITTGFDTLDECWNYARRLAKGFDLDEEMIDSDVYEVRKNQLKIIK
jgi:hypothetical protein